MAAWELCTKEDVTNMHPIPKGELEDSWSLQVEGLIRQHLGTPYLGAEVVITDEVHNGDGTPYLRVKDPPIVSVQDVRINGVSVLATDFIVQKNIIQLENEIFPRGNANVEIDYTAGGTDIDPVISLTAASMIVAIINYKKRFGADSSIKWSNKDSQTGEPTPNMTMGLPQHLRGIMRQLLRRDNPRVR